MNAENLLTVKQYADFMNVSTTLVYRWLRAGEDNEGNRIKEVIVGREKLVERL